MLEEMIGSHDGDSDALDHKVDKITGIISDDDELNNDTLGKRMIGVSHAIMYKTNGIRSRKQFALDSCSIQITILENRLTHDQKNPNRFKPYIMYIIIYPCPNPDAGLANLC